METWQIELIIYLVTFCVFFFGTLLVHVCVNACRPKPQATTDETAPLNYGQQGYGPPGYTNNYGANPAVGNDIFYGQQPGMGTGTGALPYGSVAAPGGPPPPGQQMFGQPGQAGNSVANKPPMGNNFPQSYTAQF
ncbi:unnamed protein product [Amoebophrya sp. A120]|nr:unnamed protein product [Amoebophrya sp. A120]|eukprot:GSA120T00022748001.1